MSSAGRLLTMMEALNMNTEIQQKPKTESKKRIHPRLLGRKNKICINCGHKNKKCTCGRNKINE